jgi:hypothetical protein
VTLYGASLSRGFGSNAFFVLRPFVGSESPLFVLTQRQAAARRAVKAGRRTNLRHASPLPGHTLTVEHTARSVVGMTIRGEPAFGRGSIATTAWWVQGPEP